MSSSSSTPTKQAGGKRSEYWYHGPILTKAMEKVLEVDTTPYLQHVSLVGCPFLIMTALILSTKWSVMRLEDDYSSCVGTNGTEQKAIRVERQCEGGKVQDMYPHTMHISYLIDE
jgi:hypothetical protein